VVDAARRPTAPNGVPKDPRRDRTGTVRAQLVRAVWIRRECRL